jgi:hypothetical protein
VNHQSIAVAASIFPIPYPGLSDEGIEEFATPGAPLPQRREAGGWGVADQYMDLKQILEILGREHVAGDEMTGAFLEDAVATFSNNPAIATNAIRQLQTDDPSGFALAAVRLLVSSEEKSPGVQYVAGLMFAGNILIDPLLDERVLALDAAISLARNLATAEPLLDVRLVRKMLANCGGDVRAIKSSMALRVLRLVEAISDCSRLSSYFVQLMRHPSSEVRSKVALLMGRANLNLARIKSFLASDDSRLRANAVESLWGRGEADVQALFREASKDPRGRVAINALLGLCKAGDRDAVARLIHFASSENPIVRAGAAWAMGETGNVKFEETLRKLEQDPDVKVTAMVARSLKKVLPRESAAPASPAGAAAANPPAVGPESSKVEEQA